MQRTDVIIVGGGQAGLVMSRSLTVLGVDHVVLERGRIGERWHSERWHSLNLLTTAAMSALPGMPHAGDPRAFMPARRFASYLTAYAREMDVPVIAGADVIAVEWVAEAYRVTTCAGQWNARAVVIATGACDTPYRPAMAEGLTPKLFQIFPADYRSPAQLPEGGVLVVGASSSGAQLAEEIHASRRPVTLAVGDHVRMPRRYRGFDIYAAMELAGILDERPSAPANFESARRQPSLQVVGRADNRDLNLGILSRQGIRLVGRLAAMKGTKASFSADLAHTIEKTHLRMVRTLDRIDDCFRREGIPAPTADPAARSPFAASSEQLTLDLLRDGIRSVVWATGYVRRYPWLKIPVLDRQGEIIHRGGVTGSPGLYAIGLNFMRRRRSAFIDGCGYDAEELAPLVRDRLPLTARQAA
ncbi:MAG TPA: NAD(P)/FAD-dependent oxidoreductase [Pseudolabrys sp.]|nr:NAD(P)/FAD-dependent oxidoreductase [Pseudolabrys sp.]